MTAQQTVAPCLWFDGEAEEAANLYTSVFRESSIDRIVRSTVDWPGGRVGDVIVIDFTIAGQRYQALNGGPNEPFNDRVSLSVSCQDQAEVDRYWEALTADGGEPVMCGWLKDKFGLRWQIVPADFVSMLQDENTEKARRVMEAMLQMTKLEVDKLKAAFESA